MPTKDSSFEGSGSDGRPSSSRSTIPVIAFSEDGHARQPSVSELAAMDDDSREQTSTNDQLIEDSAKLRFEQLVRRYFFQLTIGCGDGSCDVRLCHSCRGAPFLTEETAMILAMQLASRPKKNTLMCPRCSNMDIEEKLLQEHATSNDNEAKADVTTDPAPQPVVPRPFLISLFNSTPFRMIFGGPKVQGETLTESRDSVLSNMMKALNFSEAAVSEDANNSTEKSQTLTSKLQPPPLKKSSSVLLESTPKKLPDSSLWGRTKSFLDLPSLLSASDSLTLGSTDLAYSTSFTNYVSPLASLFSTTPNASPSVSRIMSRSGSTASLGLKRSESSRFWEDNDMRSHDLPTTLTLSTLKSTIHEVMTGHYGSQSSGVYSSNNTSDQLAPYADLETAIGGRSNSAEDLGSTLFTGGQPGVNPQAADQLQQETRKMAVLHVIKKLFSSAHVMCDSFLADSSERRATDSPVCGPVVLGLDLEQVEESYRYLLSLEPKSETIHALISAQEILLAKLVASVRNWKADTTTEHKMHKSDSNLRLNAPAANSGRLSNSRLNVVANDTEPTAGASHFFSAQDGGNEVLNRQFRQLVIILSNPLLNDREYQDPILKNTCAVIAKMRKEVKSIFARSLGIGYAGLARIDDSAIATADPASQHSINQSHEQFCSAEFTRIISLIKDYIVDHFYASPRTDDSVVAAVRVLSLLYNANESASHRRRQFLLKSLSPSSAFPTTPLTIVPYSTFSAPMLSFRLNFKDEYRHWRRIHSDNLLGSEFSFFNYPFLFDEEAKSRVMRIESMVIMSGEFEDAFVHHALVIQAQKVANGVENAVLGGSTTQLNNDREGDLANSSGSDTLPTISTPDISETASHPRTQSLRHSQSSDSLRSRSGAAPVGEVLNRSMPHVRDSNASGPFRSDDSASINSSRTGSLASGLRIEQALKKATNPYLVLEVRRDRLVEDTLRQLMEKAFDLHKPLKIKFVAMGEEGHDQGGVQKEFFQLITTQLFDPAYGLFTYDADSRLSWVNPFSLESLKTFEFVGVILGLAVYNGIMVDVKLPLVFYKKLLYEAASEESEAASKGRLGSPSKPSFSKDTALSLGAFMHGRRNTMGIRPANEGPASTTESLIYSSVTGSSPLAQSWTKANMTESQNHAMPYEHFGLDDLAQLFPSLHRGMWQLLTWNGERDGGSVEDIFCRQFEISYDVYGQMKNYSLVYDGESIPVTEENRELYVHLYIKHLLVDSISRPFLAIRRGFWRVLGLPGNKRLAGTSSDGPLRITTHQRTDAYKHSVDSATSHPTTDFAIGAVKLFRPEELSLLLTGVDLDSPSNDQYSREAFLHLRGAAQYDDSFHADHPYIKNFWSVVLDDFSDEQRRKLLWFVTASDRIPLGGLGKCIFVVQRNGPDSDRLPTSLTCFGRLLIPEYVDCTKMAKMVSLAIEESKGFGLV